jgi:hypothetical protein
MESTPEKTLTLPCRKYFEDRLLFFLDCKFFCDKDKQRNPDTEELLDKSIMRAMIELKAYQPYLTVLETEGVAVVIEDRVFQPADLKPKVEELDSPELTDVI